MHCEILHAKFANFRVNFFLRAKLIPGPSILFFNLRDSRLKFTNLHSLFCANFLGKTIANGIIIAVIHNKDKHSEISTLKTKIIQTDPVLLMHWHKTKEKKILFFSFR
jgi:hypothetical protein